MARDQRTRLNAELAGNYQGTSRPGATGEKTPGRNSLTGELVEKTDGAEVTDEEPQLEEEHQEQEVVAREPKKSLFELPRKEPSRQPLPSGIDTKKPAAAAGGAAPKPAPKVGASTGADKKRR